MGFYDNMAATAVKLLTKFGKPVVLARIAGGAVDPITGATTASTDVSVTTTGLIKPYPDNLIDGTRIMQGDRELVLSAEHEPLPTDKPVVGNQQWSIVGIKTIKPDDATAVVYFCQVRR